MRTRQPAPTGRAVQKQREAPPVLVPDLDFISALLVQLDRDAEIGELLLDVGVDGERLGGIGAADLRESPGSGRFRQFPRRANVPFSEL